MFPEMHSENLTSLKEELRELVRSMGATDARVATREMLAGPPSGDPTYIFPDAGSVVLQGNGPDGWMLRIKEKWGSCIDLTKTLTPPVIIA